MTRRIFGIETEYGIAYDHLGGRRLSPEEIARYLFRRVVAWGRSSNVFLPNGSRLYLDVGSHPEYATAECDRLPDLVAQDRAGEALMRDLLADAQSHIDDDGHEGRAHLLKNNTDSSGNSYGSHENYLIRRSVEFTRMTGVLLPFLVARQAMVGAGAVIPGQPIGLTDGTPAPATFGFSARSDHMWEGVSSATTRSRPIINARDEPHADAEKYRRLHVIVGDSSRSEATTELKVGTLGLILDLIETGTTIEHLHLRNPIKDIRALARDLTARTPMELDDGRRVSALDILGAYLEPAAALVEAGDHGLGDDDSAARVIDLWGRALTALETGDFDPVATELDWVIKLRLMERYRGQHDLAWDDPRIARLDLSYHDITPGSGVFEKLEGGGLIRRVVSDEEIVAAVDAPPSTTRARLRGRFIAAAHEKARDFTVDWVHLRLNDASQRAVTCKDPFVSEDERVDALIAAV